MQRDQLFYVGQKGFIRKDNSILVLFDTEGYVDFPGGKIQVGEVDFDKALQREVREETSLEVTVRNPFVRWRFMRQQKVHSDPANNKPWQELYLVGFVCDYQSGEVKLSDEHTRFEWVNKESFKKLEDGTEHYQALEQYFELFTK